MKFSGEQKTEVLEILYEIYDDWQNALSRATKKKTVDKELVEQYEKNLNTVLDFIEEFKANGEIDIPHILLWSICNRAIFHADKADKKDNV